jgi:hypothetical protein
MVSIRSNIHFDNLSSDWNKSNPLFPQGSILGHILFLIYIDDVPKVLIQDASPILFADDTSVNVTDSNKVDFQLKITVGFE